MGKKILVTGASGFIGSFLVEGAIQRNYEVWAGVRVSSSKKYLKDTSIRFAQLDFSNPALLKRQLRSHKENHDGWDYVIHCAGVTKCTSQKEFDHGNFVATKNFIESLIEVDMVPEKFIYISSLSVFGPIREDDYTPICENDMPAPNTAYGVSKIKTENYLKNLSNFPYIILRPTGVYGPRERDYFMMVKSIKRHIDFSAGYKRQDLTFIYVKDLVQAAFLSIEKDICNRSYFVSDGNVYSSRAFSDLIQKELNVSGVMHVKCPLFILKVVSLTAEFTAKLFGKASTLNSDKYKIMKQRNWQCDISPLVKELGYKPQYPLESGVKEIVAWYKEKGWI